MSRNLPRTVRHARKAGWTVLELTPTIRQDLFLVKGCTYLGLIIWCRQNATGGFVSSFQPNCLFAFRHEGDAAWFQLKWL